MAQVVLKPIEIASAIEASKSAIEKELRIALVGKTGVGKSATANTILGGTYFKSGISARALTKICQQKKMKINGRDVLLIDTPGIFDSENDQDLVKTEIERCRHIAAPGLHAVLFVMDVGRIKEEDRKAIDRFLEYFDKELTGRGVIVFTHGDEMIREKIKLDDYLNTLPANFRDFFKQFSNRVIMFNNTLPKEQSDEQVKTLFKIIEDALIMSYYSDALFQRAEQNVRIREQQIQNRLEQEFRQKQEEFEKEQKMKKHVGIWKEKTKVMTQLKREYEEKIENVREEVRNRIADKDSTCAIL